MKGIPDDLLTPAMRQYAAFKKQHPECVLFFRMGDFYEMFFDDALLGHKVLGITLTQRQEGVPMAGVPYHAVETYLRRMIEAGYRVAVADQVQDAREAKGLVDRAVTRVVTPGTLVDETLLDDSRPNRLAAVMFTEAGEESRAAAAVAELSTGTFEVMELEAGVVGDEMARLGVDEILYAETVTGEVPARVARLVGGVGPSEKSDASGSSATPSRYPFPAREGRSGHEGRGALTARPAWHFRKAEAVEAICRLFGVTTLAGFGLSEDDAVVGPAGALVRYLQETQSADGGSWAGAAGSTGAMSSRLGHLRPPTRRAATKFVGIDAASLRSLEIERTMHTELVEGSLLGAFGKCHTPMGRRRLREWLCFPLRDREEIVRRQEAVAGLVGDRSAAAKLEGVLREIQDVARISARVSLGRATPRDVVALGASVGAVERMASAAGSVAGMGPTAARLAKVRETLAGLGAEIRRVCEDRPAAHLREGGVVRDGADAKLDEARKLARGAQQWLAEYQAKLASQTKIPSLKIGYNRVFGYYIEVTDAHREKVPADFARKQTLKNAERYTTGPLREFESKITTAEARAVEREQEIFAELCRKAGGCAGAIAEFADVVADADVLATFATAAVKGRFVRPTMVEEPVLEIRGGRHPALDRILGERFVPNDCALGGSGDGKERVALALITGPNMAGKSTFIRQAALLVLLAQTGSFVPAESATIGIVDRVFTRIGASDELHAGRSTFMVEMTETASILHHATARSLVILDEIGRGTSTLDGLSLAWAITEALAKRGCRTLFATHYHELTAIADDTPGVGNLHVAVREWKDEIVFLYRILAGSTDRSYGIHVAKIAGIPRSVIERAKRLLETLEVQVGSGGGSGSGSTRGDDDGADSRGEMNLFTQYLDHPAIEELRRADLESMTPLEAFDLLRRLREEARGGARV